MREEETTEKRMVEGERERKNKTQKVGGEEGGRGGRKGDGGEEEDSRENIKRRSNSFHWGKG